jgi:hypothetical protein
MPVTWKNGVFARRNVCDLRRRARLAKCQPFAGHAAVIAQGI